MLLLPLFALGGGPLTVTYLIGLTENKVLKFCVDMRLALAFSQHQLPHQQLLALTEFWTLTLPIATRFI